MGFVGKYFRTFGLRTVCVYHLMLIA